jgi:pimeloyl-ACP methyl ester carboxylesterase
MQRRSFIKESTVAAAAIAGSPLFSRRLASASIPGDNANVNSFPYVTVDSKISLFYKDWLPKSDLRTRPRSVLFLHSWALNADMWQHQMNFLCEHGVRALAYDRRGHGRSTDSGLGYDFDTLADDLARFIAQLDLQEVVLVGHSIGCPEIVRYLSRHGDSRVARIVFVSPSLPFTPKTEDNPQGIDQKTLDQVRSAIAHDFPKWLAENAPRFFLPDTTPGMIDWGIGMCYLSSMRALIGTNIADTETDFRAELPHIKKPTLIIHGDRDIMAPLDFSARRTAELVPESTLKVYEGAPHGLFITHMNRLNEDLESFVRG